MSAPDTIQNQWVHQIFGVDPETYPPKKASAGMPVSGLAPMPADPQAMTPAKPADAGKLPQPMAADCKIVRGKVPGPINHVLCGTHGHVVDTESHMIIAHSIPEYVKAHPMPKHAAHAQGGPAAAQGAKAAEGGKLPQPMAADCKIVHGKVPGPKNHVLCSTHGHVVDTDTHMIIAHSVDEYKTMQGAVHAAKAAAPVVAGIAQTIGAALPFGHDAPAKPAPAQAPGAHTPVAPAQGAHAAKPDAKDPDAKNPDAKNGAAIDSLAKAVIRDRIVEYLHQQYNDLRDGIQDVLNRETIVIDKLKEAAPKEPGSMLEALAKGLFDIASIAFPELLIVKVVNVATDMPGVKLGNQIKGAMDGVSKIDADKAEAAQQKAAASSKLAAKDALVAFGEQVATEMKGVRAKLVAKVDAALDKFVPPPDFRETIVDHFDQYVQSFAVKELGLKMGTDLDPGVIQKVQAKLTGAVGAWLKQQYVQEHEMAALTKKNPYLAVLQGYSPDLMAEKAKEYLEENPDVKKEVEGDLRGEYTKEYQKKVLGEDV